MQWYLFVHKAFLTLCLSLCTSMTRGVASFVPAFNASGPLIELPVTTNVTSVSYIVIMREHAQRFFVKPFAKLYNTADDFIFQTYGYVVWNSPRYMAQVKSVFQHIHTIVRNYICIVRVPAEYKRPSPLGRTPRLSPMIADCDSVWMEWDAQMLPEEGNEWSFYIPGSGDRQGICVTQSAWKGYQAYIQQLGLSPVDSPSRITVKDFEAYQAAIAMIGPMTYVISISNSNMHSSSSLPNGASSFSDTPVSFLSSSNTLLSSSLSSMATLLQSPEHFAPNAKLDLKDVDAEEADISDALFKNDITTPHFHPLSGVLEDLEGNKYSSINIIARKRDFNLRSINSFGEIEALFAESFGTPVSHIDELCARSSTCFTPRHSVITSSSIYSQESAGSEEASLIDTPLRDVDHWNPLDECVYEDEDCLGDIICFTASDACGHAYSSDYLDSSPLEEGISELVLAEASVKWSNICCRAETVISKDERHIFPINGDDSSSRFSDIPSPRDVAVSEDVSNNIFKLSTSSVQQSVSSPPGMDIDDDDISCIALESDNTSAPFSIISSLFDSSLASDISDKEGRHGRNTVGSTPDRVGAQLHRIGLHSMRPSTMRLVDRPGYLDLQDMQKQLQTKTKPHPSTAVNMDLYGPVKSHARQHISTSKWTSPEFVSASTTSGVCNVSLSALEYIERRRVRLSYFLQRDSQRGYNQPPLFSSDLPISRTSGSPASRFQLRQGIPF